MKYDQRLLFTQKILVKFYNLFWLPMLQTSYQSRQIKQYGKNSNQNKNTLVKMLPLIIQIGPNERLVQPQYASTQMRLIQRLVRQMQPTIPKNQELFIVNWTKGRQIGKAIDREQTIQSLLYESDQTIPKIRVYWKNCPKYHVKIDLHSILILDYHQVGMFHEMIDLINCVIADVKRTFKLDKKVKFSLKFHGELRNAHKLAFVGRYLSLKKINNINLMINFKQDLTTDFVKKQRPGKYQNLICPISQLVMQDPVTTKCKHNFDKLCICMAIMKDNKCPVCRQYLQMDDIKSCKKLKSQIKNLKNQRYTELSKMKKEEEQRTI